jgi:hypothetical protein
MEPTAIISAISSVAQSYVKIFEGVNQLFLEGAIRPRAAASAAYQDRLKNAYLPQAQTVTPPDNTAKYFLFGALGVFLIMVFVKVLDKK